MARGPIVVSLDNMAEKATTGVFEAKFERISSVWDVSSFADLFWIRKFAYIFSKSMCFMKHICTCKLTSDTYTMRVNITEPIRLVLHQSCVSIRNGGTGFFVCKEYFFLVYCSFEMYFNRFIITDVINQVKNGGSIWSKVIVIQYM